MQMPKRSEELQRPRSRKGVRDPITYGAMSDVDWDHFEPDPSWHPIAVMIWDAALSSGQAAFYQNSDLALLYHACEEMSLYKYNSRRSAQMLHEIISTLGDLLMTEGDRRRVRVELQAQGEEEVSLKGLAMLDYEDYFSDSNGNPVSLKAG